MTQIRRSSDDIRSLDKRAAVLFSAGYSSDGNASIRWSSRLAESTSSQRSFAGKRQFSV